MKIKVEPLNDFRRQLQLNIERCNAPTITGKQTAAVGYNYSPLGNCQVGTIGNMDTILQHCYNQDYSFLEEFFEKLYNNYYYNLKEAVGRPKPLWLIDIKQFYLTPELIELLDTKYERKFTAPYKSTSGSDMVMILINLQPTKIILKNAQSILTNA